jgi:hypothetical protein
LIFAIAVILSLVLCVNEYAGISCFADAATLKTAASRVKIKDCAREASSRSLLL